MKVVRWFLAAMSALSLMTAPAYGQSLIRDAEIEELIREWSNPIFRAADLSPESVEIYLVGDASINAFVCCGQRMFVHAGIITATDLPNELIGVIAHETGHIAGGHLARQSQGQRAAMGPALVSLAAGILAAAAGEGGAAAGLLASSQQFAALEYFTFSRGIEASADQAALRYLERTGQSGKGLIAFFNRFRDQEVFAQISLERAQNMEPYFRTHPLSSDRVASLEKLVADQRYRDATDSQEDIRALRMVQAKLHGFFNDPEVTFRKYPEDSTTSPALYARAVAYHKRGELDKAVANMALLIEREPDNPYFHELLGQIYQENGRPEKALAPYERSVELKPDNALLRVGLATALIDGGEPEQVDRAMKNLIVALALEPQNSYGWYQRSRAHDMRNESALALYATAEMRYNTGDLRSALAFAQRAKSQLPDSSPEWMRANDIIWAAQRELEDGRRGG